MTDIEKTIQIMQEHLKICKENTLDKTIKEFVQNKILSKHEKQAFIQHENEQMTAYQIAIQALDKQIPKKPEKDMGYGYCPLCEQGVDDAYLFCYQCGQRLDWEVENE